MCEKVTGGGGGGGVWLGETGEEEFSCFIVAKETYINGYK